MGRVHLHRFKPKAATLTDRIVEVPFAVQPTGRSHYSLVALAASWLDVEIVVGGLRPRRFAVGAIAAPCAVSAAATVHATHRRRVGSAVVAVGGLVLAAGSARVLAARQRQERRMRGARHFEIAERCG